MRLYLPDTARDALIQLARRERRDPRDQAALIIIRALQRRGLLPKGQIVTTAPPAAPPARPPRPKADPVPEPDPPQPVVLIRQVGKRDN